MNESLVKTNEGAGLMCTSVLVNFIQDRSGSMWDAWKETLSGFRAFVQDLKKGAVEDGIDYLFSLTTFDTLVETPLIAVPIGEVNEEELAKHGPRGGTALYDAAGKTIENTNQLQQSAKNQKVIVVVVTDGHENSSREWTKDTLQKAIESKLKLGNWTFQYLGTQPETWDDAGALGVVVGSVASYQPAHASAAYAATSRGVRSLARSQAMGTRSLMTDFVPEKVSLQACMTRKDLPGMQKSENVAVPTDPTFSEKEIATKVRPWR